ncbi:hypothetical protein N2600_24615 (plasmid) [Rhizobium sp. WSM1274]|uniref:hypothetical protein n=1 Tax=Rhizobium sp. WSM1274 TaxID=3138254 RepID=UPI0021A6CFA3|nr:hypothetical protein [Rhizobium leguminosarum]UWU31397.1 hypothetical protein N2600_24615 [Rhizobium leguminosarum bv. viciae]
MIDSYCTIDCAKKKDRLRKNGSPEEAGREARVFPRREATKNNLPQSGRWSSFAMSDLEEE